LYTVLLLTVLLSTNSYELFEVAATDFTAGTAATYHLLEHPLTELCGVLNCSTLLGFKKPDFPMFSLVPRKWYS
jgi:hypothetical protein